MSADWITWALQGLLGFVMWMVWTKLDKNTNEVTALKVLLLGEYMKKEDFETYRRETRDTIHELRNTIAAQALIITTNATAAAREAATGRRKA